MVSSSKGGRGSVPRGSNAGLRQAVRGIAGCTVYAQGQGLRLRFQASAPGPLQDFVGHSLLALDRPWLALAVGVESLTITIELRQREAENAGSALVALARELATAALSVGLVPRLDRRVGRRPLRKTRCWPI